MNDTSEAARADAARAALAEELGAEVEIIGRASGRMPSGDEVRLYHGRVPGQPNRTASVAVDAAGAAHPRRRLEAVAGHDLFAPAAATAAAGIAIAAAAGEPITVDPATNDLTLPECVTLKETVTVTVPESGTPPKADVYLLVDTTGSMIDVIDAVKAGITSVVNDPAFAAFDLAWGAGNYKDFPVPASSPYAFQHQLAPTPGATDVSSAVSAWTADGGVDIPEANLFALQQVATDPAIGWRPDSRRIVVWIGDAPGHDPVCAALSGVADVTEATATAALVDAAITLVAISTNTGPGLDGDPVSGSFDYGVCGVPGGTSGQATRLTAATPNGSHTVGIDAAQIVATLTPLIQAAVTSIGNLRLVPSGGIVPFVTSVSPAGGYGPLPGDAAHTLPFDVVWRGELKCADEDQIFTGRLDVVADGVVVAGKRVRITVPACKFHHSVEMICGTARSRDDEKCQTVADGRYATVVTIYNPTTCTVVVTKYFAPLVLNDDAVGREPKTVPARPFARIKLAPGEATMDDCCSLQEAVGRPSGRLLLGVLDLVADHALEVTVTHTVPGSVDSRSIHARKA